MILPPVTQEYDVGSQAVFNDVLTQSDQQNFKLDQDNFLTTGSICLQDSVGDWFKIEVTTPNGVLTLGILTDPSECGRTRPSAPYEYYDVPLSGGSGTGAKVTIEINDMNSIILDGSYGKTMVTTAGTGYVVGDVLTIPNASTGGTGTDATIKVTTINDEPTLTITKLAGTQIDANGRPAIASTNPYS